MLLVLRCLILPVFVFVFSLLNDFKSNTVLSCVVTHIFDVGNHSMPTILVLYILLVK